MCDFPGYVSTTPLHHPVLEFCPDIFNVWFPRLNARVYLQSPKTDHLVHGSSINIPTLQPNRRRRSDMSFTINEAGLPLFKQDTVKTEVSIKLGMFLVMLKACAPQDDQDGGSDGTEGGEEGFEYLKYQRIVVMVQ